MAISRFPAILTRKYNFNIIHFEKNKFVHIEGRIRYWTRPAAHFRWWYSEVGRVLYRLKCSRR